jgi:hypothetical protein
VAADKKLTLEILLKAAGIKATSKQVEDLTKDLKELVKQEKATARATKRTTKEANKLKRGLEGAAERSGRAGKDFSRMAQGMGGLVQAYATVAANVFALSSAFLVLRRAADLSSMVKSAENFSDRFGVSVTRITEQMQRAAGGALDFAEALPSINKAVSAGVGIEQMEKLTVAATKAAQTFGGSATEALNRFISASQRGRVEIIQTLGVVIKTEQAYKEYAASIGKTALELSAFDRQQAILNATIAESEKVFAGVKIDPNPFQQFLTTIVDLKNEVFTTITDSITPFINLINKSLPAAALVMVAILKNVASRAFPIFAGAVDRASRAGIESSRRVTIAQVDAKNKRIKFLTQELQQVRGLTQKQLKTRLTLLVNANKEELMKAKAFQGKLFDQQGKANKAAFIQLKRYLGQVATLRAKGTVQKGSEFLSDTAVINLRNLTTAVAASSGVFKTATKDQANYANSLSVTSSRIKEFAFTMGKASRQIKFAMASMKSAFKSGFAVILRSMESGRRGSRSATNSMLRAWKIFFRDIQSGTKTASKFFLNLGKVVGRTAGLIIIGLRSVVGGLFNLVFWIGIAKVAWDSINERFNTFIHQNKKLRESFESLNESLKEITDRTKQYIGGTRGATKSSAAFSANIEFLRGTIDSTINAFKEFELIFSKSFEGKGLVEVIDNIKVLEGNLTNTVETIENLQNEKFVRPGVVVTSLPKDSIEDFKNAQRQLNEISSETVKIRNNLELSDNTIKILAEDSAPALIENFVTLNKLFKSQGIFNFQDSAIKSLDALGDKAERFQEALRINAIVEYGEALKELDNAGEIAIAVNALTNSVREWGRENINALNAQNSANRALQELDRNITTFVDGIDKLRSASVPNKEIVNFFLDAERALKTLDATSGKLGNLDEILTQVFQGTDLKVVKDLLGLDEADDIVSALKKVEKGFKPFKDVIEDSITAANKFKVLTAELSILKEEEATTDERRLQNLQRIKNLTIEQRELERDVIERNIRANAETLALLIRQGQQDSLRVQQLRATIETDIKLLVIANKKVESAKELKDVERGHIVIINQALNSLQAINTTRLSILKSSKKLSATNTEDLKLSKKIFQLEKQKLSITASKLIAEKNSLFVDKESFDQDTRRTLEINQQLELIKAQTRELERQQLILDARTLADKGVTIFDERGLSLAADFFVREVRDKARNLKTTFEILGKGFVKVINDSFDFMVENLLEGGEDFGFQVVETIKAGLRDVFGEALKTKIREAFASIFEPRENPNKKLEENTDALNTTVTTTNNLLRDINNNLSGKSISTSTIVGKTLGTEGIVNELLPGLKDIENISSAGNNILEGVLGAAEEGTSATKEGFLGTIGTLFKIIAAISTLQFSEAGGLFKVKICKWRDCQSASTCSNR